MFLTLAAVTGGGWSWRAVLVGRWLAWNQIQSRARGLEDAIFKCENQLQTGSMRRERLTL